MKRKLLACLLIASAYTVSAQEPADALRFSWLVPSGTARQQAVGGAMTSLGGDLSATFVNPAGLAFYKTGDFVLSPGYGFGKNKSTYLGREESDKYNNFVMGTTGFVAGSSGNPNKKVRNTAFSIAFNTMGKFNSDLLYRGLNTKSSYTQQYLETIQNNNIKDANQLADYYNQTPFNGALAFNAYLLDTVAGGSANNYQFQSRAANIVSTGLLQEQTLRTRGGIYEFALGLAANFNDKLMLGGSIGIPFLNYDKTSNFTEADATENPNNHFNYAIINEQSTTKGAGINAKLGLIYKPAEYWRVGLAFHTPTIYSLTDKYQSYVTADVERSDNVVYTDYSLDYTYNAPAEYKYLLITPYRVMGSVSYVLREIEDVTKQRGFLTADVEYVNYKASSYKTDNSEEGGGSSDGSYLKTLNQAIDKAYKGAFNFKVGGELKFTTLMFRAGAAYYGNPYKDNQGENGHKLNLSGGLGYRDKGYFIDLTYVHSLNKDVNFPYRLQYASYEGAQVKNTAGNVLLTVGFKF
ncbi:OmpP1/FadL family transporter [Flavisolibacter tropicus]|uniref:Aromatic hydrocarbon degradation membrane protein n=1 Tax=Flavisolibacter tropicus TaxID=1492898 RepID=A0A172U1F4_9BACT|nr:hypothetical protein [Flavisolibacter tropicus]ANE53086.1 hypothetical protein SY85_24040 [Flavisolibacter tropicus]